MSEGLGNWTTHELGEFLSVVARCPDEPLALQVAIERASEALEAGVGFVVVDGRVAASVGYARGESPAPDLIALDRGERRVDIPGLGGCWALCVQLGESLGTMVLIRGQDRRFGPEERNLLRGMGKVVVLVVGMLRTAADLESSRRRAQEILDSASGAFVSVDSAGMVIDWNRSAEAMFGWTQPEALGHGLVELIVPPKGRSDLTSLMALLGSSEEGAMAGRRLEFGALNRYGREFPAEMTIWRVADAYSHTFSAFIHDITQEKKMAFQQAQLAGIVQSSDSAIFSCDPNGNLMIWNPGAERLLGWTAEEVVGTSLSVIVPVELQSEIWEQFREVMGGEAVRQYETRLLHKNGTTLPVAANGFPLTDDGGRIVGASAIVDDITERKRAEAELESIRDQALEASKLKSSFLANMSHEIRTPMNGVLGMTELMLDSDLTPEQRTFAETIRGSAEALLEIIGDILDLSKIEAGRLEIERTEFDPWEAVSEVAELLALPAQKKGLELIVDIDDEVPASVVGDPGRLRQVLTNLVGNALKFTHRGQVLVQARVSGRTEDAVEVLFEVRDTGVGISAAQLPTIFEPFAQGESGVTREYGGTGLGLTITRQLVELMGGTCGVESELGLGSSFWVRIPLQPGKSVAERLPDLSDKRALVAADNDSLRMLLERMLRRRGAEVESVATSLAAIQKFGPGRLARNYDLAVVDGAIEGIGGVGLPKILAMLPAAADIAVVLLTTARTDLAGLEAPRHWRRLPKPVRRNTILRMVDEALSGEPAGAGGAADYGQSKPRENGRILVAEDNEVNRQVTMAMLESAGFHVDVVEDGQEAVRAAADHDYQLILMDCQMPVMDGYQATAQIRDGETAGGCTPIVAMTAGATVEDRERALAAGMDDYVSKPITREGLVAVIGKWSTPRRSTSS